MHPLDEQWKFVTGDMVNGVVENRYIISNYGILKNAISGVIITGNSVMSYDGRSISIARSRLVYMAFVNPIIPRGNKIMFIDGNDNNLYYKNLLCITHQEFRRMTFENNVIKNTGASAQHMSSRDYYNSKEKILCYPINEEWRDITEYMVPGINPWYLISQYGRIYSKATDSIVKQAIINSGYLRVQLIPKVGSKIDLLVHRLVALAWVYNDDPVNKTEVNHIDENTFNNYSGNLEWVTPLQNQLYSANIERNIYYNEHFTDDKVRAICEALQNGMDYMSICSNVLHCKYTGMLHKRIWKIHKGIIHTDISKDYKL